MVRPVRDLVQGTRQLADGDYDSRIPVRGSDELTQLSADFNLLADTLDQNRNARQQWIADISHELRTPLYPAGRARINPGWHPSHDS